MKYKKTEELLSLYLEDELNPEERRALEVHLRTCQKCADLLSFMEETRRSLLDFPELEPSASLMERLHAISDRKRKSKLSLDFLLRPSLQPVLAGAAMLLMMISLYLFHPNRENINKSLNRQVHLGYSKVEKLYAKAESLTDNLGAYKDNILVSLKEINPFGENED
jgi:predicted anti-sigma-YlaC factor YlaD